MARLSGSLQARIQALKQQQRAIQTRADRDVAEMQREIEFLTRALPLLTAEVEALIVQMGTYGLIPKE